MQSIMPHFQHPPYLFLRSLAGACQREGVWILNVESTAACDSVHIDCPHFLNGRLHLDLGALKWLKEIRMTRN